MSNDESAEQPSVEEVLAKIEQTPIGAMLRDERAMERMVFDLMTRSDDRVIREMGRELREGNITLKGLGDVPEYRTAMQSSLARVGDLDLAGMSEQLDELIAEQQEAEADDEVTEDDEDELWQGFGRESDER